MLRDPVALLSCWIATTF